MPKVKIASSQLLQFTCQLMGWHRKHNNRKLPWKGEKESYKIWLSEIILQQTRAEQGEHYYKKFIKRFPTIQALASAPEEDVFKLWEGLGYYNRCKNMLATARQLVLENKGIFPSDYHQLLQLKGIGAYTAAAISSFAFNKPYAVVDGNVYRVLARVFNIALPIDKPEGKIYFNELANNLLDKNNAAEYNQAIMDFGATVCKPLAPLCPNCVVQHMCIAFKKQQVFSLPVKQKKIWVKPRWFIYFIMEWKGKLWVQQRTKKDIWQHLYEFYLLEKTAYEKWTAAKVKKYFLTHFQIAEPENILISEVFSQRLTHQLIQAQFIRVYLPVTALPGLPPTWISKKQIQKLPFPKIINEYLKKENFL